MGAGREALGAARRARGARLLGEAVVVLQATYEARSPMPPPPRVVLSF